MELSGVEWAVAFHTYINYVLLCAVLVYATVTEFLFGTVDRE